MHLSKAISILLSVVAVTAVADWHKHTAKYARKPTLQTPRADRVHKRSSSQYRYLNNNTEKFAVNGSALPEVDFDVGESYAGTLPISPAANDSNVLWFWFFPTENPAGLKDITIWLNGGPGCSSLDGLFQENGPFLWQSGTYAPFANPYSWTNLTNVIWIDQPVGTGFSKGTIEVNSEADVASQFMGFWKNFVDTFSLQDYNVYITGESYAGMYVPYIAGGMLDANDTEYFNVKGVQVNDGSINSWEATTQAPAFAAARYFNNILNLNETFMDEMSTQNVVCGYEDFLNTHTTTFPPTGPIPAAPEAVEGCDMYDNLYNAIYYVNPCFNIYHLTDFCPFLWDELGFPSLGGGPRNYFNRSDVQAAIHAPPTDYFICNSPPNLFPNGDNSVASSLGPLPSVIERTNNTIIGHGLLDFLIFSNGSLITIQNMTWNGAQGFQTAPSTEKNFFVPYHESINDILSIVNGALPDTPPEYDTAGGGFQGITHTERGLTFVTVNLAGHEIPQYTPGAAYRQLEFLLGRIESLEQFGDYTTQTGNFTGNSTLYRRA